VSRGANFSGPALKAHACIYVLVLPMRTLLRSDTCTQEHTRFCSRSPEEGPEAGMGVTHIELYLDTTLLAHDILLTGSVFLASSAGVSD
jgi:hypothetical protein